ncbi:hypothetical protein GCM10009715_17320 [Paeniglutamicibacter psychrophenolicus]|uniref:Phage shock protein PspC (Stress-responsive transcriptional regulator) n=1 Tax=Paeniglutamicibacter psychrophenolicus TaxID=257454 RepID=A0ABS4WD55_9MICC|nr:PspC domain-containing protein [Paeniglutamicibacter psychrophenolicus]MBP2373976.1 phage shock protein PspC (stress-responsive transcriptional regulator) [Paeniglutamicibacter psychrophenolicus]
MNQTPVENGFFRWVRDLGVNRSEHAWIGGVAAGVGNRFGIDPILARGILLVLCLFGGVGLAAYGLAWALLPGHDGRIHLQEAARGRWSSGMTGAVLFFVVGSIGRPWAFDSWNRGGWWGGWIVPAVVVGLVLWLVFSRRPGAPVSRHGGSPGPFGPAPSEPMPFGPQPEPSVPGPETPFSGATHPTPESRTTMGNNPPTVSFNTPGPASGSVSENTGPGHTGPATYVLAPPEPRGPKTPRPLSLPGHQGAIVLGVAAVVGGLVLGMENLGYIDLGRSTAAVALASALLVIGIGVVGAAASRRTGGVLVGLGIPVLILTLVVGGASVTANNHPSWFSSSGITEHSGNNYDIAFHNGSLDLTGYSTITTDTTVNVDNAFSNMEIMVPDNIPVIVNAEGAFSVVRLSNVNTAQPGSSNRLNPEATGPTLTIEFDGAFNTVTVTPQKAAVTP